MSLHARVAVRPWLLASAVACAGGCSLGAPSGTADLSDLGDGGVGGNTVFTAGDASACRPADVETYQPSPYHFAAAAWRGVCDIGGPTGNGQDRLFFDKCLAADATPGGCSAFQAAPANAACAQCILTSDATTGHDGYGPLINHGTFITTNVAGCVQLTDPGALSCAKAIQALGGCELRACEANCPVHDVASRAAYDACASRADSAGCQSYQMAAACLSEEVAAAPSCLLPAFADFYYAVVPLFCGAQPQGDGAPGGAFDDASVPDALEESTESLDATIDAARIDATVDAAPVTAKDANTADAITDSKSAESAADATPADVSAPVLADAAKD